MRVVVSRFNDFAHREMPIPDHLKSRVEPLLEQGVIERFGRGRGAHLLLSQRFHRHLVGHTCRPEPLVLFEGKGKNKKKHVSVYSPKFICYNTATHELEDFMPDKYRHDEQLRKMFERRF